MKKRYLLLAVPILCLAGCIKGGNKQYLKDVYKDYFTIGGTFNSYNLGSDLSKHFNSLTAENDMKWISVHPNLSTYDYAAADEYITFAKKNKMGVRGHALVWHHLESIPAEVFASEDKETILGIERDHVDNVIKHFKDDVYCWDVCNEVIDDGTSDVNEDGSNIYRQSNWYKYCGRDFIKEAYIQADKTLKELGIRDKVKLFYNDYDNTKEVKKNKTIAMIRWLQEENVPLDGIGLQCHYHMGSFDMSALDSAISEYAALGLDVHITEFDCSIYDESKSEIVNYENYEDVPKDVLKAHGTIYKRAFEIFRKHKDDISNVTFWGVSDDITYMNDNPDFGYRTNYPYIFNVLHDKKPAYYLIADYNKKSKYNLYDDRVIDVYCNYYQKEDETFHLYNWYPSDTGSIDIEEKDGVLDVFYQKAEGLEYAYMYSNIAGPFADFAYINFVAKGTPGRGVTARLYYGKGEDEEKNVLGNDVSFSLNQEYSIHSLRIKATERSKMDILREICLYPEIGLSGVSVSSRFYLEDIYFSKALPDGATLENPGVDTGDNKINVNGWKTEGWTLYTLYNAGNGNTGVRYSVAAEYASIETDLEIKEGDNALRFSFENIFEGKNPSVTCIRFILRGDVSEHVSEGVEYEYDLYFEAPLYTYDLTKEDGEVQPDENNITTIECSLESALATIGSHHENGYRLTLMIESHPDDVSKFRRYRSGEMIIHCFETFVGEIEEDVYSQYGYSTYTFTEKEGVDRNISYEDVLGNAYWPRVVRKVETVHESVITLVVRNNSEENSVLFVLHAGINSDERSDAKNNMFFPLWNHRDKDDEGYYTDGEEFTIQPQEEITVTIQVDEAFPDDAIDCLQFVIDCSYGDEQKRSGNIDIVSVNIA